MHQGSNFQRAMLHPQTFRMWPQIPETSLTARGWPNRVLSMGCQALGWGENSSWSLLPSGLLDLIGHEISWDPGKGIANHDTTMISGSLLSPHLYFLHILKIHTTEFRLLNFLWQLIFRILSVLLLRQGWTSPVLDPWRRTTLHFPTRLLPRRVSVVVWGYHLLCHGALEVFEAFLPAEMPFEDSFNTFVLDIS